MRTKWWIAPVLAGLLAVVILSGCEQIIPEPVGEMIRDVVESEQREQDSAQTDIVIAPEAEESDEDNDAGAKEPEREEQEDTELPVRNPDGTVTVDLILFMGQSNMSGAGGNAKYAPPVPPDTAYEFRAISDPTRLYPITEPFGVNENNLNAILDLPGAKNGSLVSAFANRYYEETGVPIVAVSASAGATATEFWMRPAVQADYAERMERAVVWLTSDQYVIRHKYVVWLQGESDAVEQLDGTEYQQNMDNIIRPLFIKGVEKVFFITPGRTITKKDYFAQIIEAQISMAENSPYYALGTTVLSAISAEYMVDEWHYNQTVLNLLGTECANSVAYYSNHNKEACVYDYRNNRTIIPESSDDPEDTAVTPLDLSRCGLQTSLQ